MIDSYFCSEDKEALLSFCSEAPNVIGPVQGRSAQAEQILDDGMVLPATAMAGDPAKWYICIRAEAQTAATQPIIETCDKTTGRLVCGGWS